MHRVKVLEMAEFVDLLTLTNVKINYSRRSCGFMGFSAPEMKRSIFFRSGALGGFGASLSDRTSGFLLAVELAFTGAHGKHHHKVHTVASLFSDEVSPNSDD